MVKWGRGQPHQFPEFGGALELRRRAAHPLISHAIKIYRVLPKRHEGIAAEGATVTSSTFLSPTDTIKAPHAEFLHAIQFGENGDRPGHLICLLKYGQPCTLNYAYKHGDTTAESSTRGCHSPAFVHPAQGRKTRRKESGRVRERAGFKLREESKGTND